MKKATQLSVFDNCVAKRAFCKLKIHTEFEFIKPYFSSPCQGFVRIFLFIFLFNIF